uniref:Uncharacterized protein MANES_05G127000 n=1 Tax=Rhizophora mucronata TaxID=61149 RepID=A0A2P2NJY3_RHIMU
MTWHPRISSLICLNHGWQSTERFTRVLKRSCTGLRFSKIICSTLTRLTRRSATTGLD